MRPAKPSRHGGKRFTDVHKESNMIAEKIQNSPHGRAAYHQEKREYSRDTVRLNVVFPSKYERRKHGQGLHQ